eukprot:364592-Chlamydomonas_euryale.AAC.2
MHTRTSPHTTCAPASAAADLQNRHSAHATALSVSRANNCHSVAAAKNADVGCASVRHHSAAPAAPARRAMAARRSAREACALVERLSGGPGLRPGERVVLAGDVACVAEVLIQWVSRWVRWGSRWVRWVSRQVRWAPTRLICVQLVEELGCPTVIIGRCTQSTRVYFYFLGISTGGACPARSLQHTPGLRQTLGWRMEFLDNCAPERYASFVLVGVGKAWHDTARHGTAWHSPG